MNVNIHLQGHHVKFPSSAAILGDNTFRLIADLPEPISIAPGQFKRIPSAINLRGDERTIALIEVHAGADPEGGNSRYGQFFIPPTDASTQLMVDVVNHTETVLLIRPGNGIGVVSFRVVADENSGEEEIIGAPAAPSSIGRHEIDIKAVFEPAHIDRTNVPSYATRGDAGMDLRADVAEELTIMPGGQAPIPTGLRMAIPEGFEGQVRPRSGLALKHGIMVTNSPGTVDSGYVGEIVVLLRNSGVELFNVKPGDRIAQLVIAPVMRANLALVADLDATERGAGGFGSTGTR